MKTLNEHFREVFGCKVYKLSLSVATTCPNRDGTLSTGGCIFCNEKGSGNFAESPLLPASKQIEKAKQRLINKTDAKKFIAYFQSFTSTYLPPEYLRSKLTEAVVLPEIVGISVATRPDCLGDGIIDVLKEIAAVKPLYVELGLQTSKAETIEYIRRHYDNSVYASAVKKLHEIGANVVTHIIIGLPGETEEDIYSTVKFAVKCGTDGVKFHSLHVITGTDLHKEYVLGKVPYLSLQKYTEILSECIRLLPPETVVHRLTGDGDKKELISPLWSADKKKVLNYINKYMRDNNVIQGERYKE